MSDYPWGRINYDSHLEPPDEPEDPREDECYELHDIFLQEEPDTTKCIGERCLGCSLRTWCSAGRSAYREKADEQLLYMAEKKREELYCKGEELEEQYEKEHPEPWTPTVKDVLIGPRLQTTKGMIR